MCDVGIIVQLSCLRPWITATCCQALLCMCICLYSFVCLIIKTWSLNDSSRLEKVTHTQTIISLHTPLSYYCCTAPFINYPNEWINETTCWSHNLLLIPHTLFTHWILLTFLRAGDAFKCLKQPNKKNTLHPKLSLENMLHILHVHIAVANVCERTNFIYLFITDITLYQSPVKEFVLVYYK